MIRYKTLEAPISVQLELTEKCTNKCIHCYNHWRIANTNFKSLDKIKLDRILKQFIASKVMSVTITGGEPLIKKKLLLYAISFLNDSNIDVHLNSNLTLLNYQYAKDLKEHGLKSVLTSLLSFQEITHNKITGNHKSFNDTINGINQAIKAGLKVSVNMVVTKFNFKHIYQTAVLSKKIGATHFSATKVSPSINIRNYNELKLTQEQVFKTLEELMRIKREIEIHVDILECYPLCLLQNIERFKYFARRSCSAGKTSCTIGANGEVRPCSHSDMAYGNIFNDDLSIIWKRMSDWRQGEYIHSKCKECEFLAQCSGGCRMEAKYLGDICGPDPYMTSPENIKNIPKKKPLSLIPKNQPLFFQEDIRFRKEKFGGLIYSHRSGTLFVTHDSFNLLKLIKAERAFTIEDLANKVSESIENIQSFFSILIEKKILYPKKGGESNVRNN